MIIFKCKECGKEFIGKDEYEAEVLFSQHDQDCEWLKKNHINKKPKSNKTKAR